MGVEELGGADCSEPAGAVGLASGSRGALGEAGGAHHPVRSEAGERGEDGIPARIFFGGERRGGPWTSRGEPRGAREAKRPGSPEAAVPAVELGGATLAGGA